MQREDFIQRLKLSEEQIKLYDEYLKESQPVIYYRNNDMDGWPWVTRKEYITGESRFQSNDSREYEFSIQTIDPNFDA